ncbi:MAG TPA: SusC/RagA family TonB-linked outer membrane protein [Gemmatimonadaceae bacterium]|nr:SusC/RagA family TonB-linked outer membrane protein [Gemmatimonadaceae bacterium]
MSRWTRAGLVVLALGVAGAVQAQDQATIITGQVVDAASGVGIPGAQVAVVGTNVGAQTNEAGRYTIRSAPVGALTLRVLRIGYTEAKQPATVVAGQSNTVDFRLRAAPVSLAPVVTTAAGEQRREEVGHTMQSIDAARIVETRAVANMTDLLTARAPGLNVLNSTSTGGGARIRIRGASSLSLNNEPIYIIDGVRMTSNVNSINTSNVFTGGAAPSRVGDINPEEIESIEVVPGPSASTLYGTDAANGVIVITTKRGRAGATRINAYVERGRIEDFNDYPTAYSIIAQDTVGAVAARSSRLCSLNEVVNGTATVNKQCGRRDTVAAFNLFEDKSTTPIGVGSRAQYGAQVSGGTETVRFFTAGEYEDEVGVLKMADFDRTRAIAAGQEVKDEWRRPNTLGRASIRANLNANLTPKAELAVSTGFIRQTIQFPQTDNNAAGLFSNALGGPGYRDATLQGYRNFAPYQIFQDETYQRLNRGIGSLNLTYRPLIWLSGIAVFGADVTNRSDVQYCRRATCPNSGNTRQGFTTDNRAWIYSYTANLSSTATFQPTENLGTKTAVGAQYVNYLFSGTEAYARTLPVGTTSLSAGAVQSTGESTTGTRTLGAFVEQTLSWAERVYFTAALRTDQNSAFGTNFQQVYYPKFNAAWIVSEEPFFPEALGFVSHLRLRAAYGASGTQPASNDAKRYFDATIYPLDDATNNAPTDRAVLRIQTVGNKDLRPERSMEGEAGIEFKLLEDRFSYEGVYYNKLSRDALIDLTLAPSTGIGATTRRENLGAIKNIGFEHIVRARLLSKPYLGWDATATYNTNDNKIVSLGPTPFPPGTNITQRVGYPLNAYWGRKLKGWNDLNGDGVLVPSEVFVGDRLEYIGPSLPAREATLNTTFDFLERMLSLNMSFDYHGGYVVRNGTERIRCENRANCVGMAHFGASLFEQARAVALREHPTKTSSGYNELTSFSRFRELSLTFVPRTAWTSRYVRTQSASLTLGIRNIKVWTDYTGMDPESNYGQDDVQNDFQTLPPPTVFTLRFNVGF